MGQIPSVWSSDGDFRSNSMDQRDIPEMDSVGPVPVAPATGTVSGLQGPANLLGGGFISQLHLSASNHAACRGAVPYAKKVLLCEEGCPFSLIFSYRTRRFREAGRGKCRLPSSAQARR